MNAKELKGYLLEDNERVERVLEEFGFHNLWYTGVDEIRCAAPDGENRTAVSVKLNETMSASNFGSLSGFYGDIFGLLEDVSGKQFTYVINKIHAMFGLSQSYKTDKRIDLLADLRKLKSKSREIKPIENKKYSKDILDTFFAGNHISLIEEAISPKVLRQFDIMIDPKRNRVVFPHFDWKENDKIVGMSGRTILSSQEAKMLDVPKYWNYISGYKKTHNLYGYHLSKDNINDVGMIILFEAEKSVMKQFTIERGKGYSVALSGHSLSDAQIKFIIDHTHTDVEIVIAFDKDIMNGDTELDGVEYLTQTCKRFGGLRRTSYIYDRHNILGENDSPIDCGITKWKHLLKWRVNV